MLENIVQYASTDLRHVLMAKYDNDRTDYLRHAEELAHFVEAIETDARGAKSMGKDVVFHLDFAKPRAETRTCYYCKKAGHIAANCRKKRNKNGGGDHGRGAHMTLAVVNDEENIQD